MTTTQRRRSIATVACGLIAALTLATGCSVQIRSQPDPSIGDDTLLVAGDAGSPNFSRNFNPYLANSRSASDYIYEPLMIVNPLDGEPTPWLAEDWRQPDPATIEMTIRDDVEWHDSEPLTAQDVVFTFEMMREHPATDLRGAWDRLESVTAEGNTVVFQLTGADAPALPVIGKTVIVPEHIWKDVDDPATWRNENPIGSGPFTLGNFTPQQYALDQYDGYWQDDVDVEHIVFPAANKEVDLVTRGFDWGYSFMSDVEGTWGAANDDNKYWFPPGGIIGLQPNQEVAPFDDVDVRRGIALALDKQRISEVAVEGHMEPASQTGLLLPNQEVLLAGDIPDQGVIAKDRSAAIASFERAGFTLRDGTMYEPSGEPFGFSILTANGYTDALRAVQEVRRQLADIGIEVTIEAPQAAAKEAAQATGDYEVAFGTSNGGGDVYQGYNNLLSSEFYAPIGERTQNNRIRFQDPHVDELLREYRTAVDEKRQVEITHELEHVFYEQMPVISLYYGALWGLYNDGRFTGWPTADNPYAPLQTWDSTVLLVVTHLRQAGDDE